MAEKKTYTVRRQHTSGAQDYFEGDTREMLEADAKQLVELGVLDDGSGGTKSESGAKNKSRTSSPDNK